ncbi:MAG: hypothetical protein C4329_14080 [Chitinophagaceae bacterium]
MGKPTACSNTCTYLQKTDADSIAYMFTPDGELGNVAKGRDSIRHFLSSFKKRTSDISYS